MRFIKVLMKRLKLWAASTIFLSENQRPKRLLNSKAYQSINQNILLFRAERTQSLGCNSKQRELGSVLWPRDELPWHSLLPCSSPPSPPDQDGRIHTVLMAQIGVNHWTVPRDCLGEGCTVPDRVLTTGMDEADQSSGLGLGLSSLISIEIKFGLEFLSAEKGWQINALKEVASSNGLGI